MPKKKPPEKPPVETKKFRPALSPEARQQQLICLATDLAEERLRQGTASSQEVVHFLKLATAQHQMELEKLQKENELLRAKTEAIDASKANIEQMQEVFAAFKRYSGHAGESEEYYDPNIYGIGGDF